MTLAETYQDTFGQLNPEPTPVMISFARCPIHPDFHFVSMPREIGGDDLGFSSKCPIRGCLNGISK